MQGGSRNKYPNCVTDPAVPSWQTWRMSDTAFDPALVRAKMKEAGLTQAQLAREMDLPQSAISNLLQGPHKRQVTAQEASFIYELLGIERQPEVIFAPIIGLASAGNWREAILHSQGFQAAPRSVAGKRSFAVEIKGDSMDKLIPDGGFAIVDPDQTQLYNEKVYLIENEDHETQVKMYLANPARFEPCSTNETHCAIVLGEARPRVIGRVVWQGSPL